MSLFNLHFFASVAGQEAQKAGNGITALIVKFDPEAATEAQIDEFERQLTELTNRVAALRSEYNKEKAEADAVNTRYHQFLAAGENLQAKIAAATDETQKASLTASLERLVADTEKMVPDLEREQEEATQAGDLLKKYEDAAQAAATKLVTARENLTRAKRDMEKAALAQKRAEDHVASAEALAGIRQHSDSLGTALGAMQQVAAKSRQAADAAELKAKLVTGASHQDIAQDANIAAALSEVDPAHKPASSLGDRLAALKNRPTAAV